MKHEIKEVSGVIVITLEGDVDLQSSPEARKVLLAGVGRKMPLLVDLAGVGYVDSSGIASLVEALQTARKNGQEFALVAISEDTRRVLGLARLDKVFTIFEALRDGLEKLG